jgi:hypothetical protein
MAFFLKQVIMKTGMQSVSVAFGAIMVLVVLSGAIAFMFTDVMSDRLFGSKRTLFVVILFAYAAYRSFRLYQVLKASNHEK